MEVEPVIEMLVWLPEIVKEERARRWLTRAQLSWESGVEVQSVRNFELQLHSARMDHLVRYLRWLARSGELKPTDGWPHETN